MPTLLSENEELVLDEAIESRRIWHRLRPISFDEYAELWPHEGQGYELIDGVLVERMAAELEHEKLFAWLFTLLNLYAQGEDAGTVLGSRTPLRIHNYRGRMPDVLFVRKEREDILTRSGLTAAPDLIFEFASRNDRPSDFVALETDYTGIGVPEIVFVEMQKGRVRVLRREEDGAYTPETLTAGEVLILKCLNIHLPVDWLLNEPRPDFTTALAAVRIP